MKSSIVSFVLIFAARALAQFGNDVQTDRHDSIDMSDVVVVSRQLMPYVECILDYKKCSPPSKKTQARVRRDMEKECSQCREPKRSARRVDEDLNNNGQAFLNYITPEDFDHRDYEKEPRWDRD